MANWLALKQVSEKRGIAESTLREWKTLGYIASSTVDDVMMLDDESVTRFLDTHAMKELNDDDVDKLIQEKKLEREILLSSLEDELFLLKTQKLHQPLFHVVIEELGNLIMDGRYREIFLAVSSGEPIIRVAKRFNMTYERTLEAYTSTLEQLSKNTHRIATFRTTALNLRFGKFNQKDPTNISLWDVFNTHACCVLAQKAGISTLHELLLYGSQKGWRYLTHLPGLGNSTYHHIVDTLIENGFLVIWSEGNIRLTPEIAALIR